MTRTLLYAPHLIQSFGACPKMAKELFRTHVPLALLPPTSRFIGLTGAFDPSRIVVKCRVIASAFLLPQLIQQSVEKLLSGFPMFSRKTLKQGIALVADLHDVAHSVNASAPTFKGGCRRGSVSHNDTHEASGLP